MKTKMSRAIQEGGYMYISTHFEEFLQQHQDISHHPLGARHISTHLHDSKFSSLKVWAYTRRNAPTMKTSQAPSPAILGLSTSAPLP
jgi:hypothetical protein